MTLVRPQFQRSEHHRHIFKDWRGETGEDFRSRCAGESVKEFRADRQVTDSAAASITESVNALTRERDGWRSHYRINEDRALRHQLDSHKTAGGLPTMLEIQ